MSRLWVVVGLAACGFQPRASVDDANRDGNVDAKIFHDAADAAIPLYSTRINIGGAAYTGIDNPGMWIADPGVCSGATDISNPATINGTNDSALYSDIRYGSPLTCAVMAVPAGAYHVTLLFAEIYFGGAPCPGAVADRMFDIALEGTTVLAGFDESGGGGGCATTGGTGHTINKSFDIRIDDGELDVLLTVVQGNYATLNALELLQTGP